VCISAIVWDGIAGNQPRVVLAIPVFMIAILPLSAYFPHNKASLGMDKNAFGCVICPPLLWDRVVSLCVVLLGGGGYPYRAFLLNFAMLD
jgi:hypothetical protein